MGAVVRGDVMREIRVAAVREGLPSEEDFAVVEAPVPAVGEGEMLVRNRWFAVFPAVRTLLGGGVPGTPFPALRVGDALFGPAVGEVVASAAGGPVPGTLVAHFLGWREYAAVPVAQAVPLDDVLPDPAAELSQGALAYAALTRDADLRPGETVFVTGGAGAVGSMAGQVARLLGAGRVVGSTGSPDKARRMKAELGYDAVVPRDAEGLAEAAPEGLDVVIDTVGGAQLRAAVAAARPGARIVLVGTLGGQLAPGRTGTDAPVELDTFQLVAKAVTLRGFRGLSPDERRSGTERLGVWLREGRISFPHTRVAGLSGAPRALTELLAGVHLGAVIVEL
ncbi:2-alkenal reductase [Actinocorallia herbida]|uniref:2-alkenal reductase n=1 Tax=Actinocorallia herbida TaxID=58109 RepID=A0A3N1CVS6_9ACTN|nr:NADP-dependent oxidoreductase [Actinocorallia herbida]ROO85412.1 2-alkenal reductase [Actinocorallia herbida]